MRVIVPVFPTFNIYSRIAAKTTALGPVCIGTSAREVAGWDVEIIDENNLRRFGPGSPDGGADHKYLQAIRPADAVALYGGLTSAVPRLYRIAGFYQQQGVQTIAGGQHFADPENIDEGLRSGIDYIVSGEGEQTIKELLENFSATAEKDWIRGISYLSHGTTVHTPPREPISDFSQLPLPDFSLVRYAKISLYPVERIRGCGMNCEFCTVKGKPRPAAPERLLESIRLLVETRGARRFFVVDDLFGQQRDETIRFCNMLGEYQRHIGKRLKLTIQIRWDKGRDSELLSCMRQAGINMVAIGFESPIREELEAMNKHVDPDEMLATTREFRKYGFWVHGMFIFGYPMKPGVHFDMPIKERVRRYRQFIRQAEVDTIQVLLPGPLPGTGLRKRLQEQGRVFPVDEIGWEYYDGNFPLIEPDPPLTSEEMQIAARKIMRNFYGFRYCFLIVFRIFSFPVIVFFLHNVKLGWSHWYRSWRNSLLRFGGWLTIKGWVSDFKKDRFKDKLESAQKKMEAKKTAD